MSADFEKTTRPEHSHLAAKRPRFNEVFTLDDLRLLVKAELLGHGTVRKRNDR